MPNVLSLYQEDVPTDSISTISGGNYSSGGSGVSTNTNSTSNTTTSGGNTTTTNTTGTSAISEPYVDTKPQKSTDTTIQGGMYPECLQKWKEYSSVITFKSNEEMENSKKEFMTKCMSTTTTGTSAIVEPEIVTPIKDTTSGTSTGSTTTNVILPNLGGFLSSLTGGGAGGGGGATEEDVLTPNKKPFPYWIIAVAVVGGYLIFRKK